MLAVAKEYFTDLFDAFYPNICLACEKKLLKGENVFCFHCESELPQTEQWLDTKNRLAQRFYGRIPLYGAAALFQFYKGAEVQHLLHELKYKGKQEVGEYVGKMFGRKLLEENSIIKNVDVIIPVPLHWKKLKTRGYNQCDCFAKGLSEAMNIPYSTSAIERTHENISQTKKRRFDRWGNVAEIFSVKNEKELLGKHVLLVDDVVTTGATAEACMQTILSVPGTRVSFAAMATAMR